MEAKGLVVAVFKRSEGISEECDTFNRNELAKFSQELCMNDESKSL